MAFTQSGPLIYVVRLDANTVGLKVRCVWHGDFPIKRQCFIEAKLLVIFMTQFRKWVVPILDILLIPIIYPGAWILKRVRRLGLGKLPRVRNALMRLGVFPITDHYYEPQFDNRAPRLGFAEDRHLSGIDWNIPGQLKFLDSLTFGGELSDLSIPTFDAQVFRFGNGTFESGDAEFWYQVIRAVKPRRIIEIGSGNSTLMAMRAIRQNLKDDPTYSCDHICVEPFESPWLEKLNISVVRRKVEELDLSFFDSLNENDILFIDSSHIIRPQGDVLFEYLELLPSLREGVIVHVHDIFSPKNYLSRWLTEDVLFWNEQYLLEAFLSHNDSWKVIGAINLLHHRYHDRLKVVAPFLTPEREPGSFYMKKCAAPSAAKQSYRN